MNWKNKISTNPFVCHGKAHVKGTRVLVTVILDNLADGLSFEEILESYPTLKKEDIQAVIAYAAFIAKDQFVALSS